ncbi:hypothetical protein EON66_10515, partial [archaeon]
PSPDSYGLIGLLSVVRTPDPNFGTLALGTELTSLAPFLNVPEPLHTWFAHPWSETPVTLEPNFKLPACYKIQQPALKTGHFSKFDVGTLLYIFYGMPRDVLQAYAAQELYNREWRYHKERKLWFKVETLPGQPALPAFVYWDLNSWEKRPFVGPPAALTAGFLSEEEVRVQHGAPAPPPAAAVAPVGMPGGIMGAPS